MFRYFVKTPYWLSHWIYPKYIWQIPSKDTVYLTFDDGPHPEITPFVLDQLKEHGAKGSFFCVGNRLVSYPEIADRVRAEGHFLGSHTFNHVDGWKTDNEKYLEEVQKAAKLAGNPVFRPPYGHIKRSQARLLRQQETKTRIIMWDVLTGDFDKQLSPERCLQQTVEKTRPGSIVVLHDSEKAWDRLQYVLPRLLKHVNANNWLLSSLPF